MLGVLIEIFGFCLQNFLRQNKNITENLVFACDLVQGQVSRTRFAVDCEMGEMRRIEISTSRV